MKNIKLIGCLLCVFLYSTNAFGQDYETQEEIVQLEEDIQKIKTESENVYLEMNHSALDIFLEICERNEYQFPIYLMFEDLSLELMETDKFLKQLRNDFLEADEELAQTLKKDKEYRELESQHETLDWEEFKQRQFKIFERLENSDAEYREARNLRDKALLRSNLAIARHALEIYKTEKKLVPFDAFEYIRDIHHVPAISSLIELKNELNDLLREKQSRLNDLKTKQ